MPAREYFFPSTVVCSLKKYTLPEQTPGEAFFGVIYAEAVTTVNGVAQGVSFGKWSPLGEYSSELWAATNLSAGMKKLGMYTSSLVGGVFNGNYAFFGTLHVIHSGINRS